MNNTRLIFQAAKALLPIFLQANKDELGDREGVQLAILPRGAKRKDVPIVKLIGKIVVAKRFEKKEFAIEKVTRLRNRYARGYRDRTTFTTENTKKKKYGGGVAFGSYYIAASGFPPHLDQKFVLLVGLMVDGTSFFYAHDVINNFTPTEYSERKRLVPLM